MSRESLSLAEETLLRQAALDDEAITELERVRQEDVPAYHRTLLRTFQPSESDSIEPVSACVATKEMLSYWPLVMRFCVFASLDFAKSYVIAKKDLELLAAYAAYSATDSLVLGFLYSAIFSVATFMSRATGAEKSAVHFDIAEATKKINTLAQQAQNAAKQDDEKAAIAVAAAQFIEQLLPLKEAVINEAREDIRAIWRQGLIFAGLLSIPAIAFGLNASPIFALFRQSDVIVKNSWAYLAYSTPGFIADLLYRWTARTATSLGVKKSILVADTADRLVELALTYAFLHGVAGLPELGIPGVAVAYSISKSVTFLGHLAYIAASPTCFGFDYKKYRLFDLDGRFYQEAILKKLFKSGFVNGLESVVSSVSAMLVVMFCGQLGSAPLIGIQIASLYSGFVNFHISAAFNFVTSKAGGCYEFIEDEKKRYTLQQKQTAITNIKTYLKLITLVCFSIGMLACGLAFLIPTQLASLLIDAENTAYRKHLATAVTFLKVQGVFECMKGLQSPSYMALDAFTDNRFLFWMALILELGGNTGAAATTHYALKKNAEWVYAASGACLVFMTLGYAWRLSNKMRGFAADIDAARLVREEASPSAAVSIAAVAREEQSVAEKKPMGVVEKCRQLIWGAPPTETDPLLRTALAPS